MQKKQVSIIPKNMQQDLAVSQFPADAAYEIRNMRIVTTGDNTSLCLVNEKSNYQVGSIEGTVIGVQDFTDYIILFVHNNNSDNPDSIVQFDGTTSNLLYSGNLNFSLDNPIESIKVIENSNIHKIYWVDGINPVRMVNVKSNNIAKLAPFDLLQDFDSLSDTISIEKIIGGGNFSPGVIQYAFSYFNIYGQESPIINSSSLNYISLDFGTSSDNTVSCSFKINISNINTKYDYIRLYSIKRTSLDATPEVRILTDINITNLGEDKEISFIDSGTVGTVEDPTLLLYLGGDKITATTIEQKNNTLFLGNIKDITKYIPEEDRNTLAKYFSTKLKYDIKEVDNYNGISSYTNYKGNLDKSRDKFITFKSGEIYRIGLQFQYKNGKLSEVIYLNDIINNEKPKAFGDKIDIPVLTLLKAESGQFLISPEIRNLLEELNICRYRLMYVHPEISDRTIICQGIISPTVFEMNSRLSNYLYTQPSWILRDSSSYKHLDCVLDEVQSANTYESPYYQETAINKDIEVTFEFKGTTAGNISGTVNYIFIIDGKRTETYGPGNIEDILYTIAKDKLINIIGNKNANNIPSQPQWRLPASFGSKITYNVSEEKYKNNVQGTNNYYIDTSIVTLYSPEIESVSNILDSEKSIGIKLLGHMPLDTKSMVSSYEILSKNTTRDLDSLGKLLLDTSQKTLTSDYLWEDVTPDSNPLEKDATKKKSWIFKTYMWHREGSLNGDAKDNNKSYNDKYPDAYSVLDKKIFVNARGCYTTNYFTTPKELHNKPFKLILNNYEGIYDLEGLNYKGTIDIINNYSKGPLAKLDDTINGYPIYGIKYSESLGITGSINQNPEIIVENTLYNIGDSSRKIYSNDPVHIRYKTADHVVINLQELLPNSSPIDNTPDVIPLYLANQVDYMVEEMGEVSEVFPPRDNILPTEISKYKVGMKFLVIYPNNLDRLEVITSIGTDTISYASKPVQGEFTSTDTEYTKGDIVATFYNKADKSVYDIEFNGIISDELWDYNDYKYNLKNTFGKEIQLDSADLGSIKYKNGFYLADITREVKNQYGGVITNNNYDFVMSNTKWTPISPLVPIDTSIKSTGGDTYYQRWDCLNTMPYSKDDKNQVIDITSFMVESRINLDGRVNEGGQYNTSMDYINYSNINNVYTQDDTFFAHTNTSYPDIHNNFPNYIVFSMSKNSGEIIDKWTKLLMANFLEVDQAKGSINKIQEFNDRLYFFQDSAIGVVNYNNRVQMNVSDGIPIELATNTKVDGYNYITTFQGCLNKWSLAVTPSGIYFVDDLHKSILLFNGQTIIDLSSTKNMYSWISKNSSLKCWTPTSYDSIRTLYDKYNKDVYFTTKNEALAFNENLGAFSSFYDYNNVTWMFSLDNNTYQIRNAEIWKLHGGADYNVLFSDEKEYSVSIIANPEFQVDKIFDTIEFRTNGIEEFTHWKASSYPFSKLITINEYQEAMADTSSIKKKFRTWRWNIGRNSNSRDRIRNPWAKITMKGNSTEELRLYDMAITYYT